MPRKSRQLSNSDIYHVLIQGYNKAEIFKDESDKKYFITILLNNVLQNNLKILAYCVIDNHAHLLVEDLQNILSKLVKEITKKYAYYINKKYNRTGKVFHDRFRSEPIEDTESLTSIVSFIHNNPLIHNLTKHPNHYQWSSYNCYLYNDHTENSLVFSNELLDRLLQVNDDFLKLPLTHTNNLSSHKFMDCNNIDTSKTILSETQAKIFIKDYLENRNETLDSVKTNWELRYSLVHELKESSNLSIRKIAYLLSLTRGIVQNIK